MIFLEMIEQSTEEPNQGVQANASEPVQETSKWINNRGEHVDKVFGFNKNAELVNARAAMFGFLMLVLTELIFKGEAATHSIFGIN